MNLIVLLICGVANYISARLLFWACDVFRQRKILANICFAFAILATCGLILSVALYFTFGIQSLLNPKLKP